MISSVEVSKPTCLIWENKPVKNVLELLTMLLEKILHGRLSETCNLCCENKPLPALQSACGQCQNLSCRDCLKRWYGQLLPGRLYVPSEGLCPFCKRTPKAKTLRTFNKLSCRLAGRGKLTLRADVYYGWCSGCFQIKEALPRECAEDAPTLNGFQCADCKEQRLAQALADGASGLVGTKPCPECKLSTIKISGCDHMTCPCGAHWCWRCGGNFGDDIYTHMMDVHGGIGLDEGWGDASDDDE